MKLLRRAARQALKGRPLFPVTIITKLSKPGQAGHAACALTNENGLSAVAFGHSNSRDNENLSNRCFVFAQHSLDENKERRLDKF